MVRLLNALSILVIVTMGFLIVGFFAAAILVAVIAKLWPSVSDDWFNQYVLWVLLNVVPIFVSLMVAFVVYHLSDRLMSTTRRYVKVAEKLTSRETQDELDRREREKQLQTLKNVGLLTY